MGFIYTAHLHVSGDPFAESLAGGGEPETLNSWLLSLSPK
jgi:hypothetical protein